MFSSPEINSDFVLSCVACAGHAMDWRKRLVKWSTLWRYVHFPARISSHCGVLPRGPRMDRSSSCMHGVARDLVNLFLFSCAMYGTEEGFQFREFFLSFHDGGNICVGVFAGCGGGVV